MAEKDTHILIRVETSEKQRFVSAAHSHGLSLSDWVRNALDRACAEVVSTISTVAAASYELVPAPASPFAPSNIPAKLPTRSVP